MDQSHTHSHRPPPEAVDNRASTAGLRAVATFEALKGAVVLALGLGILALLHKDVEAAVENMLQHMRIDPDARFGSAVLRLASGVTDGRIWGAAAAAVAYSAVRFTEAYGLWNRRVWAEWFALLSGCLYLPWEIVKLAQHHTVFHWVLLTGNLAIIAYVGYIRFRACRMPPCP